MKLVTVTVLIFFLAFSVAAQSSFRKGFAAKGFIENKGQIIDQNNKPNPSVLFLLNTPGMNVQLRKSGFSYDLMQPGKDSDFLTSPQTNLSPICRSS